MDHTAELERKVKQLYAAKNPERSPWADWLADNHVLVVADYATELAERYNANAGLARAAALLHDIADVKMPRSNQEHEAESFRMARSLMEASGFSEADIKLVVDDAIRYHSCHGDKRPESVEGKILSAADSMAHLKTDFYVYASWAFGNEGRTLSELKQWAVQKIERDLNNKVMFDDLREELRPDYEAVKRLWSR